MTVDNYPPPPTQHPPPPNTSTNHKQTQRVSSQSHSNGRVDLTVLLVESVFGCGSIFRGTLQNGISFNSAYMNPQGALLKDLYVYMKAGKSSHRTWIIVGELLKGSVMKCNPNSNHTHMLSVKTLLITLLSNWLKLNGRISSSAVWPQLFFKICQAIKKCWLWELLCSPVPGVCDLIELCIDSTPHLRTFNVSSQIP